jgi:hypothetical protein
LTLEELIEMLQRVRDQAGRDLPIRMRAPDQAPGREGFMLHFEILDVVEVPYTETDTMALLHPGALVAEEH